MGIVDTKSKRELGKSISNYFINTYSKSEEFRLIVENAVEEQYRVMDKASVAGWIQDFLPEEGKPVLVCGQDGSMFVMSLSYVPAGKDIAGCTMKWESDYGDYVDMDEVKAWRPLPKKPIITRNPVWEDM